MLNEQKKFFNTDSYLFLILFFICLFGLFFLYSATNENLLYIENQFYRILIGFVLMFFISKIPASYIRIIIPYLFILTILFLFTVLIVGDIINGSKRWLDLYFFSFQPSELAKVSVPLFIAWYIHEHGLLKNNAHVTIVIILLLIPTLLILMAPDLGTAVLIFFSSFTVVFIGGIPWLLLLFLGFLLIIFLPISWMFILQPYQKERILTLFNPEMDPLGSGYHIIQSKIALGNGGLFGQQWLQGLQTNLGYVPEQHTDFIFSVIGEEFGFFGSILLISAYSLLIFRLYYLSKKMDFILYKLTTMAFLSVISFYVFVNIGMVAGILPVVGLPLPFISYGGTSLLILFIMLGIIGSFYNDSVS